MNRIGDLTYYTPTEIIVLESGEMEVFLDVKESGRVDVEADEYI